MRKTAIVIVIVGLPSLLTAMPTLSVYLADNEPGVGIRPREAIDFRAAGVYGWLGRLDLLQTTRTHTPPLYPHLLSKLDPGVPWTIPSGMGGDPQTSSLAFGLGLPIPTHRNRERLPQAMNDRWGPEPVLHPVFPGKPLDAVPGRNPPRLVVLDPVGEGQRVEAVRSTKATMFPRHP